MKKIGILILLLFLFLCGCTSASYETAMIVEDCVIDSVEFRFFYAETIDRFCSQYKSTTDSLGVDFNISLDEQPYSESMTWGDYFRSCTVNNLSETYALQLEMRSNGVSLSDDVLQAIDDDLQGARKYISENGYEPDDYMAYFYGEGMTFDRYCEYYKLNYAARMYSDKILSDLKYSDSEIDSFYNENSNLVDTVEFRYFAFENKSEAEQLLESVNDEQNFEAGIRNLGYGNGLAEGFTLYSNYYYSYLDTSFAEWLYSSDRCSGDMTVIPLDGYWCVLYFIERERPEYDGVTVRHILLSSHQYDDPGQTAAEIYDQWKLVGTEEYFETLARTYSEDLVSSADGGLYSGFEKGYFVKAFDDWVFDSSRKPGDSGIIESEYGFHIMYFCSKDGPLWKNTAESYLRSSDYDAYLDMLFDKYNITIYDSVVAAIN